MTIKPSIFRLSSSYVAVAVLLGSQVAHAAGLIGRDDCAELGDVLSGRVPGRRSAGDITIADLTGVATQDIAMARSVLSRAGGTQ